MSVSPVQWNNPCLLWDAYKTHKHIERAELEFLNKKAVGAQQTRELKRKFNATYMNIEFVPSCKQEAFILNNYLLML